MNEFLTDMKEIGKRARKSMKQGPITESYKDADDLVNMLAAFKPNKI